MAQKQYVNQENTQSINSWTTVDMGASYKTRVYGAPLSVLMYRIYLITITGLVSSYTTIAGAPRTSCLGKCWLLRGSYVFVVKYITEQMNLGRSL